MDIVEKLRLVDCTFWYKPLGHGIDTDLDVPAYELGSLSHEAANEIERLRDEVHFDVHTINALSENNDLLEAENKRLREALNADNQTIRLYLGEMTQQEMRAVKAAFTWVLFRAALKEGP